MDQNNSSVSSDTILSEIRMRTGLIRATVGLFVPMGLTVVAMYVSQKYPHSPSGSPKYGVQNCLALIFALETLAFFVPLGLAAHHSNKLAHAFRHWKHGFEPENFRAIASMLFAREKPPAVAAINSLLGRIPDLTDEALQGWLRESVVTLDRCNNSIMIWLFIEGLCRGVGADIQTRLRLLSNDTDRSVRRAALSSRLKLLR